MELIIYINETFGEEKALYDLDKKEIILKGDYYHDKIDYLMKGYLIALNIDEDDVKEEYIDNKHELFEELNFYNENCEDDDK